jgi:hypothetical protein
MNTILLCTDCSDNAKKAVDHCMYLYKNQNINYILLFTYTIEENTTSNLVAHTDALKLKVSQSLELELERIRQLPFFANGTITARSVYGKTENVVNRFILKNKVDLVVIGSQGVNHSDEQLFGTTTDKILRDIYCSKLIVPNQLVQSTTTKKMILAQADELDNLEWWTSVTALTKSLSTNLDLIILPDYNLKEITIPSKISHQLNSITDYREVSTDEISQKIDRFLQAEKPNLLHLNIKDRQLGTRLLCKESPLFSAFSSIPFFIEPFL